MGWPKCIQCQGTVPDSQGFGLSYKPSWLSSLTNFCLIGESQINCISQSMLIYSMNAWFKTELLLKVTLFAIAILISLSKINFIWMVNSNLYFGLNQIQGITLSHYLLQHEDYMNVWKFDKLHLFHYFINPSQFCFNCRERQLVIL